MYRYVYLWYIYIFLWYTVHIHPTQNVSWGTFYFLYSIFTADNKIFSISRKFCDTILNILILYRFFVVKCYLIFPVSKQIQCWIFWAGVYMYSVYYILIFPIFVEMRLRKIFFICILNFRIFQQQRNNFCNYSACKRVRIICSHIKLQIERNLLIVLWLNSYESNIHNDYHDVYNKAFKTHMYLPTLI